jgi:hypothetical protein
MSVCAAIIYGLLGGVFVEISGLFKLRRQAPDSRPVYLTYWFYWVITAAMALVGGGLAVVYLQSGVMLNPILAINVGASAPLILESIASQAPRLEPGRSD